MLGLARRLHKELRLLGDVHQTYFFVLPIKKLLPRITHEWSWV